MAGGLASDGRGSSRSRFASPVAALTDQRSTGTLGVDQVASTRVPSSEMSSGPPWPSGSRALALMPSVAASRIRIPLSFPR